MFAQVIRRLLIGAFFAICLAAPACAAPLGPDPCTTMKKTVGAISVGSGATVIVAPLQAGLNIYICSAVFTIGPTASTANGFAQFFDGLGGGCGASFDTLSGPFNTAGVTGTIDTTTIQMGNGGATIMETFVVSKEICLRASGATAAGTIAFVYAP